VSRNRWTGPNWPPFALGERVSFGAILTREHDGARHFWESTKLLRPMTGIVVQLMTLRDQEDDPEYGEYGATLSMGQRITRTFPAARVAFDVNRSPAVVARVDLRKVTK